MASLDTAPDPTDRTAASPRSALRAVALPSEHGGWSLTAEPVLLGLLVAFSRAGLALGGAAMLAFLARTPLKVVLVDCRRRRWIARSRVAAAVLTIEVVAIVALVAVATFTAQRAFWMPVVIAAPLVALELWFDMRSRSRRLLPEVAGTIAIAGATTVIALAGGASTALACGLWCVVGARSAAAIPSVRTQIMRLRGKPDHRWMSDLAQVIAVCVVAGVWQLGWIPGLAVLAVALVALANVAVVRMPPRPAMVVGVQQTIAGVAVVIATAVGVGMTSMR